MPSIHPDYEYDIFISYRHNDNIDGWVTMFVEALQNELRATLKNEVSIYFDKNPHDGLLETHQVDASLAKKLKCLVFIPIISQTYCDTSSFAWEHEFLPFVEMAKQDELGMNITLSNGNVTSRVLPVKIHDLDTEDQNTLESVLDGPIRAIDFIYKEPGVNRPLNTDDSEEKNLSKTRYKNQLNKVANSLKDIGTSIINKADGEITGSQYKEFIPEDDEEASNTTNKRRKKLIPLWGYFVGLLIVSAGILYFYLPTTNSSESIALDESLTKSIAVMPFEDMSPNGDQAYFSEGLSEEIINSLFRLPDLELRSRNSSFAFKEQSLTIKEYADALNVNYVVEGSVRRSKNDLRITAQLIQANEDKHIWSEQYDRKNEDIFNIQTEIANSIANALHIYLDEKEREKMFSVGIKNVEAYEAFLRGKKLYNDFHNIYPRTFTLWEANKWFDIALEIDSTIGLAYHFSEDAYEHFIFYGMDPPEEGDFNIDMAMNMALKNREKAIRFSDDKTIKKVLGINYIVALNDWSGLSRIVDELTTEYKSSSFISTSFIIKYIFLLQGEKVALAILDKDIKFDPTNPFLHIGKFGIYMYYNELDEAGKVLENMIKLKIHLNNRYFHQALVSYYLKKGQLHSIDSLVLKDKNNYSYTVKFLYPEYSKLNDLIPDIEHANPSILQANYYWQKGNKEKANNIIHKLDAALSEKNDYKRFLEEIENLFYHIPFNIDDAPNFKQRIIEAGIDPGFFKPMPQFSLDEE